MLFATNKKDLNILTHGHAPLAEINSLRQVGSVIPVTSLSGPSFAPRVFSKEPLKGRSLRVQPPITTLPATGKPPLAALTHTPETSVQMTMQIPNPVNGAMPATKAVVIETVKPPYLPVSIVNKMPLKSSMTALRNPPANDLNALFTRAEKNFRPRNWPIKAPLTPQRGEAPAYQHDDRAGYYLGSDMNTPFYAPDYGLGGFSLKKISKKVTSTVKQAVRKPLVALAKIPTAPLRLITDPIGGSVAKAGKSIQNVTVGAQSGAVTGFVASGFNPVGLVVGAAAGTAKGIADVSKSGTGDPSKILKQSAAYGAGAGAITLATTAAIAAKNAAAAKAANIALFAGKSGYVPAAAATTAKVGASVASGALKAAGVVGKPLLYATGATALLGMMKRAGVPPEVMEPLQDYLPGEAISPEMRALLENELYKAQQNPAAYDPGYIPALTDFLGQGAPFNAATPYATDPSTLAPPSGVMEFVSKNAVALTAVAGLTLLLITQRRKAA